MNPMSGNIVGGNSGCIEVAGTPTTAGQYVSNLSTNLNVQIPATIPIIGGTAQDIPGPLAYNFEILGPTSVDPAGGKTFSVGNNHPNPGSDFTRISFTTTTQANISLEVHSLTGQRVHTETAEFASGEHNMELDLTQLEAGVYFYTLSNGFEKVTRRLMVAR